MKELYQLINENRPTLSRSELDIADYVMANSKKMTKLRLKLISENCYVSTTSVIRFCKKIGFDGYKSFYVYVQMQQKPLEVETEVTAEKSTTEDAHRKLILQNVTRTLETLNIAEVQTVAKKICEANRIDIYGLASSRYICQDLARKLKILGVWCECVYEEEMIYLSSTILKATDLCIVMSLTGNNDTLVDAIDVAKKQGCYTISITNDTVNRCAVSSDLPIYVSVNSGTVHYNRYRPRYIFMIIIELIIESCIQILDTSNATKY